MTAYPPLSSRASNLDRCLVRDGGRTEAAGCITMSRPLLLLAARRTWQASSRRQLPTSALQIRMFGTFRHFVMNGRPSPRQFPIDLYGYSYSKDSAIH